MANKILVVEAERIKMAAVLGEMTDGIVIVDGLGQVQLTNQGPEHMFL